MANCDWIEQMASAVIFHAVMNLMLFHSSATLIAEFLIFREMIK